MAAELVPMAGKVHTGTSRPTSASTRPTSAGSAREGSPGLAMSQRPTSAGSRDSAGRPSTASLYRPTSASSAGAQARDDAANQACSEGPSRPASAKNQATQARSAAPETEGFVSTPHGQRSGSPTSKGGRLLGAHSLENTVTQGTDSGRRALEEELQQPVLTPIPNSLATSLEKQLGTAIGLKGKNRLVPRLPRDVVHCLHGQNCCWRWLARAAMEEICGSSLASVSLADGISQMKEETW